MSDLSAPPLETPLHAWHVAARARMVPFAGWEMPVYYAGINREVQAVRQRAGVFDVSHMGRLELSGPGSLPLLQYLTVNNVTLLAVGAGHYSLMLRPDGGILDDLIIYRRGEDRFLVVVNASNRQKIIRWIGENAGDDVELEDVTRSTGLLALQGPQARRITEALGVNPLPRRFHLVSAVFAGAPCAIARTGYTGEDGVEVVTPGEQTERVWSRIVQEGAEPCGLGARDTLRLEAAYCLYGHELTEETSPLEAGLTWTVKWEKGEFVGREALLRRRAQIDQRLIGLEMAERSVPRQGQIVLAGDTPVGQITSGTFSPTLEKSIALAYVTSDRVETGSGIEVDSGGKRRAGAVCNLPFYRSPDLSHR